MATSMRAQALRELLRDARLWRGDGQAPLRAEPTGHAELDALLPGGGWPWASLSEIVYSAPGVGELQLAMPLLVRLARARRRLAMIAPPHLPYAPALAQHGLDLRQLVVVDASRGNDALWAAEELLRAQAGAVLLWQDAIAPTAQRRLQLRPRPARASRSSIVATRRAIPLPWPACVSASPAKAARRASKCSSAVARGRRGSAHCAAEVAMLWLCLHLPHLPVEALGFDGEFDVATEQRGASRWLVTAAPGVGVGTPLGAALSLQPLLRAHARHVKAERAALRALAHRLYHYGSPVHAELREFDEPGGAPQALLWLEASASLRLFGGYPNLQARLDAEFADGRHRVSTAVAPTRAAAALFACAGGGVKVRGMAALARLLASRPIGELPWRLAQLEALRGVGLRRIGELRALPRKAFARRFGADRLLELDRLYGDAAEPAEAIVPPPAFQRRFEFSGDVERLEGLQFPLRRLAYDLQGWLRARDVTVRELRLDCLHAHGRTRFTLRFLDAHRDAARIFDRLRERLAREPLGAAVRALELRATALDAAAATQADLFDGGNGQAEWTAAVERIAARLGAHALWMPATQADQRPDRAWRNDGEMQTVTGRPRPLWLLHRPQALPDGPAGESARDANVERIESGWWDGADQRRDYYVVEWQRRRAWVFRTPGDDRWFLHGLWG
ncbi:MAG: hypothetical protein QM661_00950 [Solimonas sp.]